MKSPAFQFYPKDWLSDPNVIAMTATERGAYIQLLASMWLTEDCQLKDDPIYLSRIAQVDKVVITSLYPCFKVVNGWLRHKRLDQERLKQEEYRLACSNAGKKGMKNRWSEPKRDKVVITNDNTSSSITSTSTTTIKEEEPQTTKKSPIVSEEEFLATLKASPAYQHVNLPAELSKMDLWLLAHPGRKKTRRFVTNWLDRVEAPLSVNGQKKESINDSWDRAIKEHKEKNLHETEN